MATNPSSSGGNPPVSGNGSHPPANNKPRATIILKNPNAKGSSPVITPAAAASPGSSQKIAAARPSLAAPSPSTRRPAAQIQADREALGLSAARPSETVAGLGEAVKRAEALAAREEAKRKSGGKLSANVALHVDDTGRKWTRWVQLGIVAVLLIASAAGAFMLWSANRTIANPRVQLAETRTILNDLEITAKKMDRFEPTETITVQSIKERMRKNLQSQLETVNDSIQRDHKTGRNPDKALTGKRDFLENLMTFKDGWGKPLEFTVNGDELAIRTVTSAEGALEPVKIHLRGNDK